jgi:hypothetical protein
MSQEMADEMGLEFDDVIDRLRAGQSPEDIERTTRSWGLPRRYFFDKVL